jgi:ABC-type branched-subunit amino acid transport system ATPase component
MTVLENLLVAQHNKLMRASGMSVFGLLGLKRYRSAELAAIDKARQWLERIRLIADADRPAGELPYGAQRRLEIARAMCTDPRLLCLDEPAAGLNPRESAELNDLLVSIRDLDGVGVLLIEHDMSVVMRISDHVVVLDYGRKIAEGAPDVVSSDTAGDPGLSRHGRGRARCLRSAASPPSMAPSRRCTASTSTVAQGEIVTLIGANGAGKSTLLMTVCGNPRARAGHHQARGRGHHQPADPRDRASAAWRRCRRAAASSRA